MIGALSSGILTIAINMGSALASPISILIQMFFPQVANYIEFALSYVAYICTFVPLIISISMIPRAVFRLIFDYTVAKTGLYFSIMIYRFIINFYNKLKP